ncbi:MAG: hypothetical protein A2020_12750 [Lentisphaerae bacterium GWF2_45_14]|nr:MAG: hypothetical protein A2020_12750 [Lentisphaerae bacterium GWF2_45_14]
MNIKFRRSVDKVFTPYYNKWNQDAYWRNSPFSEMPCNLDASSTSGAPVVIGENFFAGLTSPELAIFNYDKGILSVEASEKALFITENESIEAAWTQYHSSLDIIKDRNDFGKIPEYCTWVEQVWQNQKLNGASPFAVLSPQLIYQYLDAVDKQHWPRGRFTVDAGWSVMDGPGGVGDWEPRPEFDMKGLAQSIQSAGHIPGLWLAPGLIHPKSRIARQYPHLVGKCFDVGGECIWSKYHFINPCEESQQLFDQLLEKIWCWGFRKVKLDVLYGPKMQMTELHRQIYQAAKKLPDFIELEGHIPDPFCSQYVNVVRTNDVMIAPEHHQWENVVHAHFKVCHQSSPTHLLNLDHIGGNCANISEDLFLKHLEIIKTQVAAGYPVISLLPYHVSEYANECVSLFIND